ncbi:hypothetical protein GCM10027586_13150 [Kineococcus gypseus]|uniref:hypothetical protein n=1 Tax=Kineococcus gypseus TaxID=1637102 RepID=UPI003D7C5BA4
MSTSDNRYVTQGVHDLASALWFGGTVMGIAGVNKSGSDLTSGSDRIRVAASAWQRFQPVQWGGIATILYTGSKLTAASGDRIALQKGYGSVGLLKIGFVVGGAVATAYASFAGKKIAEAAQAAEQRGEPVSVKDATIPTPTTPADLAAWQRKQRVAQFVQPLLAGGNIFCNAYLVQSYRAGQTAKGVLARLNPLT